MGRTRRMRTLQHHTDLRLMEALKTARGLPCQAAGEVEIGGDVYRALEALNHAVDDVCVATGRPREHFWAKANSALPFTS